MNAPTKQIPKMVASISSGPPPCPFTIKPAVKIAPKKAKLVP